MRLINSSLLDRMFSEANPMTVGWLAISPPNDCPTSHRYLRSPCWSEQETEGVYLGGPISWANYNRTDMVECKRYFSDKEPNMNKLKMTKARGRKLAPGKELLWSYNIKENGLSFYSEKEWQLVSSIKKIPTLY